MKRGLTVWAASLMAGVVQVTAHDAGAHTLRVKPTALVEAAATAVAPGVTPRAAAPLASAALLATRPSAPLPSHVYSNTTNVRAIAVSGETLWTATSGGVEQYNLRTHARTAVYSTQDGLPTLSIDAVKVTSQNVVIVSAAGHDCAMPVGARRFACSQRPLSPTPVVVPSLSASNPANTPARQIEGAAVTASVGLKDGREVLGTAGLGVWARRNGALLRVTPTEQIASNHVVAISEWGQSTWFATFDHGLSVLRDGRFYDAPLSARMLNDVLGTSAGLFVATSEGLFVSEDGQAFHRDLRVAEKAITDLAYDSQKHVLYVAATNSLWELDLVKPSKYGRSTYQPGGTRSLQAVDVSTDGTVFLATEDRGVLRRETKKRYTTFDRLAGAPSSWVIDVLALNQHSALGGTLRHGVFSIDDTNPVASGVDPWILFLGRDATAETTVFVGTQEGAFMVEDGVVQSLKGLPHSCVHSMARVNAGLWVGTEGGLALYRADNSAAR